LPPRSTREENFSSLVASPLETENEFHPNNFAASGLVHLFIVFHTEDIYPHTHKHKQMGEIFSKIYASRIIPASAHAHAQRASSFFSFSSFFHTLSLIDL
jgi:hypothetical protein